MDDAAAAPIEKPGWPPPADAFLRSLLALPELALVDASCDGERRLHQALVASPRLPLDADALRSIADADARTNYQTFLGVRDALLGAGSLEAYYLGLLRSGPITVPPVFVDRIVAAIVGNAMDIDADAFERRAGQLLYRQQRIGLDAGRILSADLEVVDGLRQAPAFDVMRLGSSDVGASSTGGLPVLGADNAHLFGTAADPFGFVLDLSHERVEDLGHGLHFTTARAGSGQVALARMLERWIGHLLDVATRIQPLSRIDDAAWAWHIGLDVDATAMLDDLYRGQQLEPARLHRLICLFRLDFIDAAVMRADLAGKPVYLGLAMSEAGTLRLKAQNLLVNLPLAADPTTG